MTDEHQPSVVGFGQSLQLFMSGYSMARLAMGKPMTVAEIVGGLVTATLAIIAQCDEAAQPALIEAAADALRSGGEPEQPETVN